MTESAADTPAADVVRIPASSAPDGVGRRRAILVSVAVFLLVMFVGLYGTISKMGKGGPETAATSYMLRDASLRLQPSTSAGASTVLSASTVVSLTGMAVDTQGTRWFVLRKGGADGFLALNEVAPPKVRLPELGSQMLRAWLLAFRDPSLVPEADSAVVYFCANFPASPHCDELRWLAAERFRSLAQSEGSGDALNRAVQLYQAVADSKGAKADEAAREIERLNSSRERSARTGSKGRRTASEGNSGYNSSGEYALVDRAEVQVKVPNLKSVENGTQIKTPIAREIRINGKVAVPSNATCILKVSGAGAEKDQLLVQLVAIEFGKKRYAVITQPKSIPPSGAMVVFPLESSLLIGK